MTQVGRRGRPTRIRIGRDGRVTTLAPGEFVTPRFIARRGSRVRVCLVGHQAMLLAGDNLDIEIEVDDGAQLELVESAATVAYNGRGGRATWNARARVTGFSSLIWRSEPFVVAAGADVERSIQLAVEDGGVAAVYESLVLGRHREPGGAIRSDTRATVSGRPVLVERLDLRDSAARSRPGVLGESRVLASALAVGLPICSTVTPYATPLPGPGGLARVLGSNAHQAEEQLRSIWESWRDSLRCYRRSPEGVVEGAMTH